MRKLLQSAGFNQPTILTQGMNPIEILNAIRNRRQNTENGASAMSGDERVESSYNLNEKLAKNKLNRMVKALVNGGLGIIRMGDSLKIWAVK